MDHYISSDYPTEDKASITTAQAEIGFEPVDFAGLGQEPEPGLNFYPGDSQDPSVDSHVSNMCGYWYIVHEVSHFGNCGAGSVCSWC